jgi:clan AA aspartic protease (TIGR02281 family)
MVLEGGTYWVPVTINDVLKVDFTVDSGASDVQITPDVLLTLMRTKTLTAPDFLGQKNYQLADGTTAPSDTFMLHELRVGNHTVRNVRASVSKSLKGTLLLGQSFLSRFKSWTLDNSAHALVLTEAP